jgi:hypothetical protein
VRPADGADSAGHLRVERGINPASIRGLTSLPVRIGSIVGMTLFDYLLN